nr:hypothetical protein [uncultured Steroidobacter sp.]
MRLLIVALLLAIAATSPAQRSVPSASDKLEVSTPASRSERRFFDLVLMRVTAIDLALGPILDGAGEKITVDFARRDDTFFPRDGPVAYDPDRHTLIFRRSVLSSVNRGVKSWAKAYWPYYKNDDIRALLPVIELIDNALWMTHLQEAAHRKGLSWPHEDCAALEIEKRLGCEMLVYGVEASRRQVQPFFNTNRIDLIWPEDLQEANARGWRQGDVAYRDVQQLGGSMLIRPLIAEFGVPRVLQYIAQTPFYIQDGNVRASAERYQEQARMALTANAIN